MLGNITVSHMGTGGGDMPDVKRVQTGLLGADYEVANGRYRFSRVYNGENWNPQLRAPLTQPGVNVKAGEYLLAVERPRGAPAGERLQLLRRSGRQVGVAARGPGCRPAPERAK